MQKSLSSIIAGISRVLVGKEEQIKLALCCLLARGHLLIEDLPGMGKTTLAQALAKTLGLSYSRIQFTSDLLPADVLGVSVYSKDSGEFQFHPGPIFSQILLADEINRTTPKTQSALLEAMAEKQVTVEGETRKLSTSFFVIATQNPSTQAGTFPLPESQLDRFLIRLSLGYPDQKSELSLLQGLNPQALLETIQPLIKPEGLPELQQAVDEVEASSSLLDYLQRLVHHTRTSPNYQYGLSPRGTLALLQASKAWAFIHNRKYVIPEDIQMVFTPVAAHRVTGAGEFADQSGEILISHTLNTIDIV